MSKSPMGVRFAIPVVGRRPATRPLEDELPELLAEPVPPNEPVSAEEALPVLAESSPQPQESRRLPAHEDLHAVPRQSAAAELAPSRRRPKPLTLVHEGGPTSPTFALTPTPRDRFFNPLSRRQSTVAIDMENSNEPKTASAVNSGAAKRQAHANLEGGFASIGRELDDNAPLWRVYRDDVRSHDQNVTLDEWNKTLDVLLIFAGLFSAVVATLVVATVPLLNPQEDYVATALYTLARSLDKDTTLSAPKPVGPAESSSLWINGLWITSLFISLSVAFFAILAKQWLAEYNHRMADPPADPSGDAPATPTASLTWARRRGFFFDGFDKWHVPALVTQILPLLLHIALFLFLVGLAVFIWTLNRPIARGMIAFTALLFALYIISTILPVWRLDCPTATPLIRQAREVYLWFFYKAVELCTVSISSSRVSATKDALRRRLDNARIASWDDELPSPAVVKAVQERTLQWMILVSGSESAISLVFQSLGALHPDTDSTFIRSLRKSTAGMSAFNSLPIAPTAVEVVRAIRSELVLGRGSYSSPMLGLDLSAPMIGVLKESYWPDAKLLWASMNLYARNPASASIRDELAEHISSLRTVVISSLSSRTSTSLHSTALLLLRSAGCPQRAVPYLVVILAALETGISGEDRYPILRAYTDALSRDRQMRAAGEPNLQRASPQLYHLLDGDESPICDCARTAGIICTALTIADKSDCQIGGWIIHNCSRNCHCETVAPEWCAVRQLFDETLPAHSENFLDLYQGADTWRYSGALLLTLLSLGYAATHVLDYTSDYELDQILKYMLDLESSKTSIRSEVWLMVLTRAMTSRRAPASVAHLQWILAAACVLKGRGVLKVTAPPFNQAVEGILKVQVDTLLASPGASKFADSPDYRHLSQHLVEFDPGYESHLNAIHKNSDNAATPYKPGKCVTCPAPKSPPSEKFCSLGPLPIIQTLLDEEMELDNKGPRIASKTWALLLPLLDSNSLDALNPFAMATLLAGVCHLLRRRGGDETLKMAAIERVLSSAQSRQWQLEEAAPLSEADVLPDLSDAIMLLQELLHLDGLTSPDRVVILDWLTQPRWSINPPNLPPTLDLADFGKMTTIRDAVDESRPLREILWRHMTTGRLADASDDSIDVTRTRRVIDVLKSLGPLSVGGKFNFTKDAAEKIVAAYTRPVDPVHSTASDDRTPASSPSISAHPSSIHANSKS